MRWQLSEPEQPGERLRRDALLARADRFWDSVQTHAVTLLNAFRGGRAPEVDPWLTREASDIHPGLRAALRVTPEDGLDAFTFHLWAGDAARLEPLVQAVLARAPARKPWRYAGVRPPVRVDEALAELRADDRAELRQARFVATEGKTHALDVELRVPSISPSPDLHAAAWALVEALAGSEIAAHWLGTVWVQPAPSWLERLRGAAPGETLAALPDRLQALRAEAIARLPREPWARRALWSRPRQTWAEWVYDDAHPGPALLDVPVRELTTVAQPLIDALAADVPFSSQRFSAHGERYAQVRLDDRMGLGRAQGHHGLARAVDRALVDAGAGAVVAMLRGTGQTGLEIASADPTRAAEVLRRLWSELGLPARAWLLPHDAAWADEWAGLHPDTPPPGTPTDLPLDVDFDDDPLTQQHTYVEPDEEDDATSASVDWPL
jgi:hypothetical protein